MALISRNRIALWKRLDSLEKIVAVSVITLGLLTSVVLIIGDRTVFKVSHFSWEKKKISPQDRSLVIQFNQPVNKQSVEDNFEINPPLGGTISWTKGNLIYSVTEKPLYGNDYQIKLEGVTSKYGNKPLQGQKSKLDQNSQKPYFIFSSHDRAFVYIGVKEEEKGRLILKNITQNQKIILTPPDIIVTKFEIYPDGEKILFSAFEKASGSAGFEQQQLYTITTGLNYQGAELPPRAGRLNLVLSSQQYQNLKFDLSKNGKTIVVQRKNRQNPADSGLWVIPEGEEPRALGLPAEDFIITPDGQQVAVRQRRGIALTALTQNTQGRNYYPEYSRIIGFSPDGLQKLVEKENPDFTRSLILLNSEDVERELYKGLNPVLDCQFEPREQKSIYCIKIEVKLGENGQYVEEPFLSVINLQTGQNIPLLALPNYKEVKMSMSPDGVALIFDQVATTTPSNKQILITDQGKAIADGLLWLLPLPEIGQSKIVKQLSPQELDPGFRPQWVP